MSFTKKYLFFMFCVGTFIGAIAFSSAYAQPAESDFCVVGTKPKQLYEPAIKSYYQYNEIVMAGYRNVINPYKIAAMRNARNADVMVQQLEEAKTSSPQLERTMWGVIIEPPTYVDHHHSCDRLSKTNIPLVSGEYPIIFNNHTPRVIGDMCSQKPLIRFDVSRDLLQGAQIRLEDFYDPAYSSDRSFSYVKLEHQANRNQQLPAFIRALMGIRMTQCEDLPASMTFVAESEDKPVMTASVLFLDKGIHILKSEDATAQRIVAARTRAKEQLAARLDRSSNWEERAAVGAAVIFTGIAIMSMNRCNDQGNFGNTALPDCK